MRRLRLIMPVCVLATAIQGCTVFQLIQATVPGPQTVPASDRIGLPGETARPVGTVVPISDAPAQAALAIDNRRVPLHAHIRVTPQGIFPVVTAAAQPKTGDHTIELTLVNFYGQKRGFAPSEVDTVSFNLKEYGEDGAVKAWKALNLSTEAAKLKLTETQNRLTGSVETNVEGYDATTGQTRHVRFLFDLPYSP